jgi:hypothetical protein
VCFRHDISKVSKEGGAASSNKQEEGGKESIGLSNFALKSSRKQIA